MDHWTYEYIQRLVERGYLGNLNPLVQPYRRLDVARGLVGFSPDTLRRPVSDWVRRLQRELAPELSRLSGREVRDFGFEVAGGARASTSRRLDPTRPTGGGSVWPYYRGGGWLETGPVAAETRAYGDFYFRDDPDGEDPGFDPRTYRGGHTDNAYLSVVFPLGSVDLGAMQRNWGPIGTPGMTVSNIATPYPSLALDLHQGRFTLRAFVAQLDTIAGQRRHMVAHRLDYRHRNWSISLGETQVYASSSLLLRFANPVDFFWLNADDDPPQNSQFMAQVWWRNGPVVVYLDGLLDDLDVKPEGQSQPPRYGFTVGSRWITPAPWMTVGLEYQQVAAWTYRTVLGYVNYSYYRRGLGLNYSDYDRLTLSADLYPPVSGLRLTPLLLRQRQGEGNFRDPVGAPTLQGLPTLFLGIREDVTRLGLRGRYQPLPFLWASWDVGANVIRNRDHAAGVNATVFEGTGEIGVRLPFPGVGPD